MNLKFEELSLSAEMLEAINDMGFAEASPIQSKAIPLIFSGKDVIGQAQTGTGKTAAFGIPLVESIDTKAKGIQAVVMCPTRELALQVSNELKKLAKHKRGVNIAAVYGGESIDKQILAIKKGAQVIIGTPGRIIDHLERRTLKFSDVKMIVLDEADEMLNMGFREDIENILERMPEEKQTVLFSATMPKAILDLTAKYQNSPTLIKIVKNELTVPLIDQIYYEVKGLTKMELMSHLIDRYNLQLAVVFCNTKKKVDEVVAELSAEGYKAEALHGDLRQNQRNQVMGGFRKGQFNILVATDVAARGIDVDSVDAVINFDLPLDDEYYIHRIGRTGRAGKEGKAFTLVTNRDIPRLREIQNYTKVKVQKGELPSREEMAQYRKDKFLTVLKLAAESKNLSKFMDMVEEFETEGFTSKHIAAALLKIHFGGTEKEKVAETDNSRGGRSARGSERERSSSSTRGKKPSSSKEGGRSRPAGKMVRLFINVGKMDRVRPGDIVGALAGETGIAGDSIGSIDIYDKFSFVEVLKENVQDVLDGMIDNTIKGRKVSIEVAKGN